MTYYERINELRENTQLDLNNMQAAFDTAEVVMTDLFGEQIMGAELLSTVYGTGKVTAIYGSTLDTMSMEVTFSEVTKRFAVLPVITGNVLFLKFADIMEIGDAWDEAFNLHIDLTRKYRELKALAEQQKVEAQKKAEAAKKAEAKYQKLKEKAIRDFDDLVQQSKTISKDNEFYYALGWLAKHIGSMTAILPDYLGASFEKYFGAETPKTLVDGRAKTSGGYAKQWSWEFKCTIKKLKETVVPACIQNVTTDFSKGIHNTAFLWDLVTDYGFQFGKKQDIEKIKNTIPAKYIDIFNEGLTA